MAESQPGQVEQSAIRAPIFSFRDQVKDFARPNLFQVEIYAPPILQDGVSPQSGGVAGSSADASENCAGGSQLNADLPVVRFPPNCNLVMFKSSHLRMHILCR